MTRAIYLVNELPPDPAVINGLHAAKCEIIQTQSINETLTQIRVAESANMPIVLICELGAGAIPLLALLRDGMNVVTSAAALDGHMTGYVSRAIKILLPTMVYDRGCGDVSAVIQAFHFGASDYVLASAPEADRALAARLLVERCRAFQPSNTLIDIPADDLAVTAKDPGSGDNDALMRTASANAASRAALNITGMNHAFTWDSSRNVIRCEGGNIFISPTEGRIFDMLTRSSGSIVSTRELLQHALQYPSLSVDSGVERLRTHVMKLRRKLDAHSATANHIINVRGTGYMFL